MSTTVNTNWNPKLYDEKHAFVFKYGEDLVDTLKPMPNENILDIGCGTGYLANVIASFGAKVIGIDSSAEMILKAKHEYPGIEFKVMDASNFHFDEPFDAIFSNATLHWVLNKEQAIDCMYTSLKRSGRLVFEMGGKGNVQDIVSALETSLIKHGFKNNMNLNPWYFPSISEYSSLLEKRGFRVTYASHYNRPTELKEDSGIKDWVKMFAGSFLQNIDMETVDIILNEVVETLRPTNYKNGKWYADYKRLRIIAVKERL